MATTGREEEEGTIGEGGGAVAVAVVIRVDGATARCQNKESSLSLSACDAGHGDMGN